jgi:hypothetical protein
MYMKTDVLLCDDFEIDVLQEKWLVDKLGK